MAFRRFTIDWRKKALAFWVFDRMPLGRIVYYQVQKRITKTVPRVLAPTAATARRFLEHYHAIASHFTRDLGRTRFLEFGAGWDLYGNIVLWSYGINSQTIFDLHRWVKPDQVNIVIRHLASDPPPGALRLPREVIPERGNWERKLRDCYGIDYRAPADAGQTGLPSGSIDVVVTTSVLEHVPEPLLRRLLSECRRVMNDASVMSHVIDYSDHYSHSDSSIGPYNFLRFSDEEWRRFNPDLHFQNRLRHADYGRLFQELGFRVISEVHDAGDGVEAIAAVPLSERFKNRTLEELVPVVGQYVLKKT
jgi:hypothetical protein